MTPSPFGASDPRPTAKLPALYSTPADRGERIFHFVDLETNRIEPNRSAAPFTLFLTGSAPVDVSIPRLQSARTRRYHFDVQPYQRDCAPALTYSLTLFSSQMSSHLLGSPNKRINGINARAVRISKFG